MYNVNENIFIYKRFMKIQNHGGRTHIIYFMAHSYIYMRIHDFFKNDLHVTNCKIAHIYAFKLIICIIYFFMHECNYELASSIHSYYC